jgi:hypothetical protein
VRDWVDAGIRRVLPRAYDGAFGRAEVQNHLTRIEAVLTATHPDAEALSLSTKEEQGLTLAVSPYLPRQKRPQEREYCLR